MRNNGLAVWGVALAVGALTVGCKSGPKTSDPPAREEQAVSRPSVPIPPDSPFAKVKMGMGKDEVFATIGNPTNINSYQTGKAWIPFHFSGSDNVHMVARYKGIGTITFSNDSAYTSGMSVISVDYDPTEPGFERQQ